MSEYQWRDFGDGKPIRVKICTMCGVAPTNVDDCGEFGNPECPYFGIGREEYEKMHKEAELQELLKDKARLDVQRMTDNVNPAHYKKGGGSDARLRDEFAMAVADSVLNRVNHEQRVSRKQRIEHELSLSTVCSAAAAECYAFADAMLKEREE